jgi:integrase
MTTREYARLLSEWSASIGLDSHVFGTHSLWRTKATLIYCRQLRAVQLLLGHTIESTVRYLGIEHLLRGGRPNLRAIIARSS